MHGACKAEFYTCKSYIRVLDEETKKYKLLVVDQTLYKHWGIVEALVSHVKAGRSKEELVRIRDKLQKAK